MTNLYLALAAIEPTVDIDVHRDGGGSWLSNPLYVGIGVVVLLLVVLIAVTAAKRA